MDSDTAWTRFAERGVTPQTGPMSQHLAAVREGLDATDAASALGLARMKAEGQLFDLLMWLQAAREVAAAPAMTVREHRLAGFCDRADW